MEKTCVEEEPDEDLGVAPRHQPRGCGVLLLYPSVGGVLFCILDEHLRTFVSR